MLERALRIILLPAIGVVWFVGWLFYYVGENKNIAERNLSAQQTRKRYDLRHKPSEYVIAPTQVIQN
jgi:hypothetical protein